MTTKQQKNKGFTLIEIMVSISIFAIIITTGMGALLQITRSYQVSKNRSAVISNLHFAIESMVRDIRLGDTYYAGNLASWETNTESYRDSTSSSGDLILNIKGAPGRGNIRYQFNTASNATSFLSRSQRVNGVTQTVPMVNSVGGIRITNALFRVIGSNPNDDKQPSVFIYIRGEDTENQIPFVIQTFVSQRNLDI